MTDTKATPTDRLLAGLDAMGAAYNMPPGTTAGRLMLDAAKEIRALRTALTPTTDGEREAREALFFADRDHAAGFRCVPEPIHRALSTALNLLAAERAKAADAARERDELRAALLNERGEGEPPSEGWAFADPDPLGAKPCDYGMEFRVWMKGDVLLRRTDHTPAWRTYRLNEGWCAVAFGPAYDTAREAMKAADAHTKVTP